MALKIIVFLFVFAILYLLLELVKFIAALRDENTAYEYQVSLWRMVGIGLSLAYVITIISTGFGI